ncbi:MAG: leucine-rich repeat protein, partial [Alistipes sp.]|nr:leucine-rich repeat protein [Alistipes sp.]
TLTSKKFGAQSAVLTYNGTSWSTAVSFLYLDNETPAVSAIYAPCYEVTEDGVMKLKSGMQLGMAEYIPADCSIANGSISINFTGVKRTYSRLRIAADAGQKLAVTTTGFTPAGATEVTTEPYTLTANANGNAFLYGLFAKGATVSVCNGSVEMESHTFTNATEERVSYALDATYPYLNFTASAAQTMTIKTYGGYVLDESMQYSVNGGEWAQLTAGEAITFGGDNGTLRLRGKSANGTATSDLSRAQISFGDDNVQVACSGDIRTLVDYENHATVSTANARFCSLFESCKSLTTSPELPATTLAESCYEYMFYKCTSLTVAPELPATTLTEFCYNRMFYKCTSLTVAPELPATTLAQSCYEYMFYGCTSLTVAPELPATTLAESCYYQMFSGCTNLTAAPELKATTLAESCYSQMFSGCTNLTAAPELPATTLFANCYYKMFNGCTSLTVAPELPAATLVNWCYYRMFYGCTNLSNITMLATDISASGCLNDWVSGVASTGTFTKAASLIQGSETGQIPTGTSGIPEGWTVVNK